MSSRPLGKLCKLVNMQVSTDDSGKRATVQLSGVGFDDINRTGNISVWRVLHWLTGARVYAYHMPDPQTGRSFLEYDRMTADYFTFLGSSRTTISRELYRLMAATTPPRLAASIHLGYVGGTSLNTVAELVELGSGQQLAINTNQVVVIDKSTRKPTPIPQWWRDTYESYAVERQPVVVTLQTLPSGGVHRYTMKIPWSDTDAYRHTNYLSYLRYCMDAAQDALCAARLVDFDDDILRYGVSSVEMSYKGETNAGDALVISLWQDESDSHRLHFSINKEGVEGVVFQANIDFYHGAVC